MGLIDLLSVVLGVRAADAMQEIHEVEATVADLRRQAAERRAQVAYSSSEEGEAELRQEARRKYAVGEAGARNRAVSLWIKTSPRHRLRPDLRASEADGGTQAGSDLPYEALDEDVEQLYAAAFAGGSYQKFIKRFVDESEFEEEIPGEADFSTYQTWLEELRQNYGDLVEDIFIAYDNDYLCGFEFFSIRQSLGLEPADLIYSQRDELEELEALGIEPVHRAQHRPLDRP